MPADTAPTFDQTLATSAGHFGNRLTAREWLTGTRDITGNYYRILRAKVETEGTDTFNGEGDELKTMTEFVVSQEWLAAHLDEVTVVDVRDAWEFDGIGHLSGAVNVPFDAIRAEEHAAIGDSTREGNDLTTTGETGMLPDEDDFAALLGERGIDRSDRIVAYDDHHGVFAARFLVTALLFGHPADRLSLLDGDFSAWQRSHETTTAAPETAVTTYEIRRPAETPLVDTDAVATAIDDPETVIVDTRERWEFDEGHIPGAVWLDWRELVDDETRGLATTDQLEAVLGDRGITPDKRVILYCNTARRISHTYLVLRQLGYPDLAFYEGSLTQWKTTDRPVET